MLTRDRFGLELTTNANAAEAYRAGVDAVLAGKAGALGFFEAAVGDDPHFALAHAGRVLTAGAAGQEGVIAAAREAALTHVAGASQREQGHVQALFALLKGAPSAQADAEAHLAAYPNDALVIDVLSRQLFFYGGVDRKARLLSLFENHEGALGHDEWFWTKYGFHLQEAGRFAEAESLLRRALAADEENANAWHGLAHALHGQRRHEEARAVIEPHLERYDGDMAVHLSWHMCMLHLAADEDDEAWSLYERRIRPPAGPGPKHLAFADAVGLLFSARHLKRAPPIARDWAPVLLAGRQLPSSPGRPFVAAYLAVAQLGAGDVDGLAQLVDTLKEEARGGAEAAQRFTVPFAEAALRLAGGDLAEGVGLLEGLAPADIEMMGGSNIERGLVYELLFDAYRRDDAAGAAERLRRLLGSRTVSHPLLARALALR